MKNKKNLPIRKFYFIFQYSSVLVKASQEAVLWKYPDDGHKNDGNM